MKVLQINSVVNTTSTGRIVEEIGDFLIKNGHECYIAFGRKARSSNSTLYQIGNKYDVWYHGFKSLIFDNHGLESKKATLKLVKWINSIRPDIILLYNIHGYYINYPILFKALSELNLPVFWTLFDCWAFTGHCTYYDIAACQKWQKECFNCPNKKKYPSSIALDQSKRNYLLKKQIFNNTKNLTLITHSEWLKNEVFKSFLKDLPVYKIPNGVDTNIFKIEGTKTLKPHIILGVANIWTSRKGLDDFIYLSQNLGKDFQIILVGVSNKQATKIPSSIKIISRTENTHKLAELYSSASVFVNPTYEDNFPTTNLEALACGTPVITYKTGGSPEAIDSNTGIVVPKGDKLGLVRAIHNIVGRDLVSMQIDCRLKALNYFDKDKCYAEFLNLMQKVSNQMKN